MTTLAAALANDFRTDEAIQLYWQAFEKSEELDDQTSLVMKLTELHLQLNQFDRLIERLERGRREEETRRAMTICLAQAHHTAGDYGTARAELESLLTTDTRDTELLLQLSKLCEAGQDFDAAAEYQRQIASIAPGPETEYRLAQIAPGAGGTRTGDRNSDATAAARGRPVRMLRGVDSLLNQTTFEAALAVIEPLRRDRRDDWELLYREGVAWASLERADEAARPLPAVAGAADADRHAGRPRGGAIPAGAVARRSPNSRGGSARSSRCGPGRWSATNSVDEIRNAVGLEYEQLLRREPVAADLDAGRPTAQARMAAYGWLLKFAQNGGTGGRVRARNCKAAAADAAATRETLIDWLYVQRLQNRYAACIRCAASDWRAAAERKSSRFYLEALPNRGIVDENMRRSGNQPEKQPPLPDEELDFAVECLKSLLTAAICRATGTCTQLANSVMAVVKELKLADRNEQANAVLEDFATVPNPRRPSARCLRCVRTPSGTSRRKSCARAGRKSRDASWRSGQRSGGSRTQSRPVHAFGQQCDDPIDGVPGGGEAERRRAGDAGRCDRDRHRGSPRPAARSASRESGPQNSGIDALSDLVRQAGKRRADRLPAAQRAYRFRDDQRPASGV